MTATITPVTSVALARPSSGWQGFTRSFRASWVVAAIVFAILSIWWISFFPAISTNDSYQSWDQARNWVFQDWHPVFYTWLMALLTRVWDSPAIVTASQMLFLCAVLGSMHRRLLRLGLSGTAAFLTPVFIGLSPQTGLTSMAMWKDPPFAFSVLWMLCEVIDIAADSTRYFSSWRRVVRLAAALSLVMLFRHNGKLLVAGVVASLVVAHWKHVRRIAVSALLTAVVFLGVTGPLYSYLDVWRTPAMFSYTMFIHDMAAVINEHEDELEPKDRAFLNEMLPINRWKAPSATNPDGLYFCRQATGLIFADEFWYPEKRLNQKRELVPRSEIPKVLLQNPESAFLEAHRAEFRALWIKYLKKWPGSILGHRKCVGSMAWSPWHQTKTEIFQPPFQSTVNDPELVSKPLSKGMRKAVVRSMRLWDRNGFRWITWRAVSWVYAAFVVALLVALRRRGWRFLVVLAPTFCAWISVVMFTPGQSARYMFPAYLCALTTLPFLSLLWRERRGARELPSSSSAKRVDVAPSVDPSLLAPTEPPVTDSSGADYSVTDSSVTDSSGADSAATDS